MLCIVVNMSASSAVTRFFTASTVARGVVDTARETASLMVQESRVLRARSRRSSLPRELRRCRAFNRLKPPSGELSPPAVQDLPQVVC